MFRGRNLERPRGKEMGTHNNIIKYINLICIVPFFINLNLFAQNKKISVFQARDQIGAINILDNNIQKGQKFVLLRDRETGPFEIGIVEISVIKQKNAGIRLVSISGSDHIEKGDFLGNVVTELNETNDLKQKKPSIVEPEKQEPSKIVTPAFNVESFPKADYLFVATNSVPPGYGIWLGPMKFTFGTMENITHYNPQKQKIIVAIEDSTEDLPNYLKPKTIYYWKGGRNYDFIKTFDTKKDIDDFIMYFKNKGNIGDLGRPPWNQN
jgi:hypothetical protein